MILFTRPIRQRLFLIGALSLYLPIVAIFVWSPSSHEGMNVITASQYDYWGLITWLEVRELRTFAKPTGMTSVFEIEIHWMGLAALSLLTILGAVIVGMLIWGFAIRHCRMVEICDGCGYSRQGATSEVCPECGELFAPLEGDGTNQTDASILYGAVSIVIILSMFGIFLFITEVFSTAESIVRNYSGGTKSLHDNVYLDAISKYIYIVSLLIQWILLTPLIISSRRAKKKSKPLGTSCSLK